MINKITISDFLEAKQQGKKIAAVSCYDFLTAKAADQAGADMLLVGDSAAQVVLGFDSTLPAQMDYMVLITSAVARASERACIVADMPFLSYQTGTGDAVRNAGRFFTESGAQIVKIEAGRAYLDVIKAVSDAGMSVMAHIGLRPQQISKTGRFKAEATTAEMALDLIELARQMEQAGASSLLLEATAAEVAGIITENTNLPVIGCGSGPDCDGQILIAPDILGMTEKGPKFSKNYENFAGKSLAAFGQYSKEVHENTFPDYDHSYHMKKGQFERLQKLINRH